VYTVDEILITALKHAALGQLRDALLEPRPEGTLRTRSTSRTYPQEVRQDAGVLRRAKLTTASCSSIPRAARQGEPLEQEGPGCGDEEGGLRLDARQVQLHTNHFPIQNFYLLKTVTGPAGQDPVMEI